MALLVVQTTLVASRRTPLHRRLGVGGGVLAALMTIAAIAMTLDLARRAAAGSSPEGLAFVIVPFMTLVVFPVLVGRRSTTAQAGDSQTADAGRHAGVGHRRRRPHSGAGSMPLFFVLTDIGLVAMIAYDLFTRGRPHAATVWSGLFLVASQIVRITLGGTAAWIAFARMLGS
jgi:hypothetical protein